MTPYEMVLLLHYHVSPRADDYPTSAHYDETIGKFLAWGLLERRAPDGRYNALYQGTDRLSAYVEALCEVPLPIQKWVMP